LRAANSPLGDHFERLRLEADDNLAEPGNALVVARERPPAADRVDAHPGPEADVRVRALDVTKESRVGAQPLTVAPLRPLLPAADELCPAPRLPPPGRMRVRLGHPSLPPEPAGPDGSMLAASRPVRRGRNRTRCGRVGQKARAPRREESDDSIS